MKRLFLSAANDDEATIAVSNADSGLAFEVQQDGRWMLHESNPAVLKVWSMAKQAMAGGTKTQTASSFNQRQITKSGASATTAPPSVSATRGPVGNSPGKAPTAKDPLIDPKTGKKYDDPWQAVLRA